ncbi:uncharacterized protein LOC124645260 isoform X3 [Helicoverpa zea]|uniref:uncharacterized protein LOC124642482 isoform X3 n=1 Tax=Helicoverpa zea TaxID=7113 RepID=UPI001F55D22E|nr:uncharacterized protein LOC124642482 isoform X3 [Helicoverpa zea]XP_047041010.1 uncharacterized protein LOC124645260 isoform X3 [Helicoverpa zea]
MTDPKSAQTLNNPNECDIPHLNTYKKRRSSHKGKVTVFKNYLESLKSKKPLSDLDIIQLRNRLESYKYLANEFDKNQTLIDDITGVSDEQLREREQFEMDYQSQLALGIHLLRENETAGVDGCPTATRHGCRVITESNFYANIFGDALIRNIFLSCTNERAGNAHAARSQRAHWSS